jgi:hypothetical protein
VSQASSTRTVTFVAGLRHTGIVAPMLINGARGGVFRSKCNRVRSSQRWHDYCRPNQAPQRLPREMSASVACDVFCAMRRMPRKLAFKGSERPRSRPYRVGRSFD